MITNLRYADDIILLATSEAELQELVDRLDRVSRRYSLLINIAHSIAFRVVSIYWQGDDPFPLKSCLQVTCPLLSMVMVSYGCCQNS